MDHTILATYFDGDNYSFDWLENNEDATEWLDENKEKYTQIEVISINVMDVIYQSDDIK
ncbi:MAG TPA: hypothetical protein VIM70_20460 [Clostridium sp.]|uniref:hypothetical protein n=1 Tax=Clostridium sp. TaxID=1506 RepID=UPI002F945C42